MGKKVIIFPTDTVYGIGTSVYNKDGIDKIYSIKKRDRNKPLAVLCAHIEQIEEIAYVDDITRKIINKFLPGGLTLILNAKKVIVDNMGIETVGVRIPDYKLALDILAEVGPMATTSVNESGEAELNDYDTIYNAYNSLVDIIYKPSDEKRSLLASTVIDVRDGIKVLRDGAIKLEDIKNILE